MRQAIGSTWILQLVIIFMLIFVGFLALSLNYTKAFRMKNEVLSIIEKYEGVSSGENKSISIINNYLRNNGYSMMGSCETDYYGVSNLNSNSISKAASGQKYYYCIRKNKTSSPTYENRFSYDVELFFQFNLPVIGDFFTFRVSGTTIDINNPQDDASIQVQYR